MYLFFHVAPGPACGSGYCFHNGTCNDTSGNCSCDGNYLPPYCRYRDCKFIPHVRVLCVCVCACVRACVCAIVRACAYAYTYVHCMCIGAVLISHDGVF